MKSIDERAEACARIIADTVTDEWNFRNFESVITLALEELAADLNAEKDKEVAELRRNIEAEWIKNADLREEIERLKDNIDSHE